MNMASDHDVEEEILEAAATLYNIRTPQSFDPSLCRESNAMVKEMVDVSGGEMFEVGSSTSMQTALKKTIQNLRYQYTLGFSPSDQGEAGSYHKLDVKLRRPELCPECGLLTRKGYYTGIGQRVIQNVAVRPVKKADIEKTNELLIQRSILTAGTTTLDLKDISIDIQTTRREGLRKQPQLIVYLNIDPAGIAFKKMQSYRIYNLQVALFYADKNGEILGNDWRRLEDALDDEDYGRIMKEGIGFQTSIPIKAEEQMLKVVVYDAESDRIGSRLVSLSEQDK